MMELGGVGDESKQWEEFTGYAYHVRRRLTPEEEEITGPAIDMRETAEWNTRFMMVAHKLPEVAKKLAYQEMVK